jgi:hypothetical protein
MPVAGRLNQLETAIEQSHVAIGGNYIYTAWSDFHTVHNLKNLHFRKPADNLCQHAFMVRSQMLDQDIYAIPVIPSSGIPLKKASKAASPPADAPMPTIGKPADSLGSAEGSFSVVSLLIFFFVLIDGLLSMGGYARYDEFC